VPFRFTGEIEKLVIDLKPTATASAPGRPDRATDHRHQPLKFKNLNFSAGTQKKKVELESSHPDSAGSMASASAEAIWVWDGPTASSHFPASRPEPCPVLKHSRLDLGGEAGPAARSEA